MGSLSRPKNQPNGAGPLTTADSPGAVNGGVVLDRARERVLLGSLTNSYKFKDDGMMKKVRMAWISIQTLPNRSFSRPFPSRFRTVTRPTISSLTTKSPMSKPVVYAHPALSLS